MLFLYLWVWLVMLCFGVWWPTRLLGKVRVLLFPSGNLICCQGKLNCHSMLICFLSDNSPALSRPQHLAKTKHKQYHIEYGNLKRMFWKFLYFCKQHFVWWKNNAGCKIFDRSFRSLDQTLAVSCQPGKEPFGRTFNLPSGSCTAINLNSRRRFHWGNPWS